MIADISRDSIKGVITGKIRTWLDFPFLHSVISSTLNHLLIAVVLSVDLVGGWFTGRIYIFSVVRASGS